MAQHSRYTIFSVRFMRPTRIFPIILAAGGPGKLGYAKALARFGDKTALEIAVENCAGLEPPIVVLGYGAAPVCKSNLKVARFVLNRNWRRGQLTSLLAGLRRVPRGSAFLLYPVDQPLLTRKLVERLVKAFRARRPKQKIVMPRAGKRAGHPIVCDGGLRGELRAAQTAREVVYRDQSRIRYVRVADDAIWSDFDSNAAYRRCLRQYRLRQNQREKPASRFHKAHSPESDAKNTIRV
ncbi:MAG: NTP transferase domain-containing protein [Candidatus Acidiferrales bacterium]|jgi:CTP:molybdopterin cytidylyltransferase MocA